MFNIGDEVEIICEYDGSDGLVGQVGIVVYKGSSHYLISFPNFRDGHNISEFRFHPSLPYGDNSGWNVPFNLVRSGLKGNEGIIHKIKSMQSHRQQLGYKF